LAAAAMLAALPLTSTTATAGPPGQGGVEFRAGGFIPAGSSDFWGETEDNFTLDHSDLNGLTGTVGYVAAINNWVEFDVDASAFAAEERSSDRDFVDDSGNLILHDTRLFTVPVAVSFRVLPAGRYARRGTEGQHYVRRPVPYLGAGFGLTYWQYEEEGDFVFADVFAPSGFSIAYDRVKDSGLEFETHVKLGIEFPVAPRWNLTLEVRRSWAEANLDDGIPSLALSATPVPRELDLGGVSVLLGASLRF
jgi:outer membrane protein W